MREASKPTREAGMTALRARLVAELGARTGKSKAYADEHRPHHADKSSIGAEFDPRLKEIFYPIVLARAEGASVWDLDGNRYVDILQGLGTNLFGHNPSFVREAIAGQLEDGFPIGPQTPLAGEVARQVAALTGAERVCLSVTGTEAVMTAIRIARTATGRDKIAVFTDSYHGHSDAVLNRASIVEYARRKVQGILDRRGAPDALVSGLRRPLRARGVPAAPGIPKNVARDVLVLEYDNPRSLDVLRRHRKQLAAVLVEPVQSRCPERQPVEFLRALRTLTQEIDAALVFDEMVTGFRVHPAGAHGLFGIEPDLATYSKIAGGGFPLSIIAGAARFLDHIDGGAWRYGDDSAPSVPTTFFAGTFAKHPLALRAAHAVFSRLLDEGPALQADLTKKTAALVDRLNGTTTAASIPVRFTHFGSFFGIALTESALSPEAVTLLSYGLLNEGIFLRPGDKGGFLTTAHDAEDVEKIASAFERGLHTLRDAGALPD
ncbi:MAG: aminotransferase class III-fold pyridoxal phosphate-dependent enzyme [Myxococcota bacterium]